MDLDLKVIFDGCVSGEQASTISFSGYVLAYLYLSGNLALGNTVGGEDGL